MTVPRQSGVEMPVAIAPSAPFEPLSTMLLEPVGGVHAD
jgi:hypothetical protein